MFDDERDDGWESRTGETRRGRRRLKLGVCMCALILCTWCSRVISYRTTWAWEHSPGRSIIDPFFLFACFLCQRRDQSSDWFISLDHKCVHFACPALTTVVAVRRERWEESDTRCPVKVQPKNERQKERRMRREWGFLIHIFPSTCCQPTDTRHKA